MNDDEMTRITFGGDSGAEFFDSMADSIAKALRFECHGELSEHERIAFVWGFRHAASVIHTLMTQAADTDEASTGLVVRLLSEATAEWNLALRANLQAEFLTRSDATH